MKARLFAVVVKVQCLCNRDGQAVWVRIRMRGAGSLRHTEPCWNCKRTVAAAAVNPSRVAGFVETIPGTNHMVEARIDVEHADWLPDR